MRNNKLGPGTRPSSVPTRDTRASLRSDLEKEIEKILSVTSERYTYLDTIELLFDNELTTSQKRLLRRLASCDFFLRKSKCGMWRVRLHRPSSETVSYIVQFLSLHIVSRVDFATDFIVPSPDDAVQVSAILTHRLSMPWRGNRTCKSYKGTRYFSQKWKRRNIVVYCDKLSKITKENTAHVEFRWFGAEVCRNIGIREISDAIGFDPFDAMCRQSRFSTFSKIILDKAMDEISGVLTLKHGRKGPMPWHWNRQKALLRIQGLLTRLVRSEADDFSFDQMIGHAPAQALLDVAGGKNSFFKSVLSSEVHFPIDRLFAGARLVGAGHNYRAGDCRRGRNERIGT